MKDHAAPPAFLLSRTWLRTGFIRHNCCETPDRVRYKEKHLLRVDSGRALSDQRSKIEKLALAHRDPVARVTRIYLEEPSFCLGRQRDVEFEIKRIVAGGLGVSYRSIAIAGSAQLGFSPHKGTNFIRGESDMDLAIIDSRLFQTLMEICISETRAFSDFQKFTNRGGRHYSRPPSPVHYKQRNDTNLINAPMRLRRQD